ncbi:MAG: zinc ribbon domain-containing protein [Candidatus Methanomethylophilaceae archaeon]
MTEDNKAFCTSCGALLPPDSTFCQECGSPVGGSDYVPVTFERYQEGYAVAKAGSRLKMIYFLMAGYMIIGIIIAITGMYFEQFVESLPSDDPTYIEILGENYYNDLLALVGSMELIGTLFLISVLVILGSLVLSIMKRYHRVAVILCAAGSLVLLFTMSIDGIIFTVIGLGVTYLLYTTSAVFTD